MKTPSNSLERFYSRSPVHHFKACCFSIAAAVLFAGGVAQPAAATGVTDIKATIAPSGLRVTSSGFEENKGQVLTTAGEPASFVRFRLNEGNTSILLLGNGIAYQFNKTHYPEGYAESEKDTRHDPAQSERLDPLRNQIRQETFRMDMLLEGANADALVTTEGRSQDYNMYYGQDAVDVHSYTRVTYHAVYPGIDWVVYTTAKGMKYDFVVHPGADPAQIQLRFKDHEELSVNADGQLLHGNRMGRFTEERPVSFQNGKEVGTRFVLDGDLLRFALDAYDRGRTLTIDPARIWGTYYGGTDIDGGNSFTEDADGNMYWAGFTVSNTGIASGGYQNSVGGYDDAFLVKFNGSGMRQWGTYYGGSFSDFGNSSAVDGSGNVYLAGSTQQGAGLAYMGHQNTYGGGSLDLFLVKFDPNGVRQWATYYGGAGDDYGAHCAVDSEANVYLSGSTNSGTGIASGGYRNTLGGGKDAFLAKFNTNGARQWATYYGGAGDDSGGACAVDGEDNVYLAGSTQSNSGIANGGHQNTNAGGSDAFLVKFNAIGGRKWATYYGGAGDDSGVSCAMDGSDNVYLEGLTKSTSGIAYAGHQNTFGGIQDAFLVKFNTSGLRQWGTYYGGTGNENSGSCAVDGNGNVYLAGTTQSTSGIASGDFQNTYGGGGTDAYLAKFTAAGIRQWAIYYGGTDNDDGMSCAIGDQGTVYLTGRTGSNNGIASGGYQNTIGGNHDAYLVKFDGTSPCDFPASLPYLEDFESTSGPALPTCMTKEVVVGNSWYNQALSSSPSSPLQGMRAVVSGLGGGTTSDSWLYTPGYQLTAGTSYRIGYDYAVEAGDVGSLRVMYGSTRNHANMTTQLADHIGFTSTVASNTVNFIVPTTGTYYIGFQSYGAPGFSFLMVDNISLMETSDPYPHDLALTATTATSASFSWLPGVTPETGYEWEVRTSGLPGSGPSGRADQGNTAAGITAAQANGLSTIINYTVYVRAAYGPVAFSPWLNKFFLIPASCSTQAPLPYFEDFESVATPSLPSCMSQWLGVAPWETGSISEGGVAAVVNAPASHMDPYHPEDYLFTPGLSLSGGTRYRLRYSYRGDGPPRTEKLFVAYGLQNNLGGMTDQLANHYNITNSVMQSNTVVFTPATSGIYYIGFAHNSDPNEGHLYLDDILVEEDCLPPSDLVLSEVTASSIVLGWNASPSVVLAGYQMEARTFGAPGSGDGGLEHKSSYIGVVAQSYFTAFEAPATYQVYLRSRCGVYGDYTFSDWVGPETFTNQLCPPVAVPYTEDFNACIDERLPSCISVQCTAESPMDGARSWNHDSGSAMSNAAAGDTTWFYTPGLILTAGRNYTLKYNYRGFPHVVAYGGAPDIASMNHVLADKPGTPNWPWEENQAHFTPSTSGTFNIGFRSVGGHHSWTYIDDISVFESPAPIDLMANYITLNSALLSWSLPGGQPTNGFQWEVRTSGLPGSGTIGLGAGGNSLYFNADTAFNLSPGTTYSLYVRSDWSGGAFSPWAGPHVFTTLACPGNPVLVNITTDNWPQEITWEITDANDMVIANGGPTAGQANTLVSETLCLGSTSGSACYGFRMMDSYGDGISNGSWEIRTTSGRLLLGDAFANGSRSPSATPAIASYTQHGFCLPPGNTHIGAQSCGIFNFTPNSLVYCTNAPGATSNQFEFSDPDAGFIRRITVNTNKVRFNQMVTSPLTPGVKYFVRARNNAGGDVTAAHFGGGCEVAMSSNLPCTELINAPQYAHSCNEERSFNTNNSFIYANPVVGATEYQFRISIPGEGYDQTFTRSTYILQLKWNSSVAPPLVNGSTYNVQVNVKIGTLYSGFCGDICTITINNSANRPEASMVQVNGTATLWPNPVFESQVNLSIDGIQDADQNITVDINDIYGKEVFAKEFENSGERFTTILDLPGDIASGVYMVNITVNGKRTLQRLSIIK